MTKNGWLELLFENADIVFSAEEIVGEACECASEKLPECTLSFHWNEEGGVRRFDPYLVSFHGAVTHEALPEEHRTRLKAARSGVGTSLAEVRCYGPIRVTVRVTEDGSTEIEYDAPKACTYVPTHA